MPPADRTGPERHAIALVRGSVDTTTKGQVISIDESSRSANPSALPPWVSTVNHPSMDTNAIVTTVATGALSRTDAAGPRRAVNAGQMAMTAAPMMVNTMCCVVLPTMGSGLAAMPIEAAPETINATRADRRRQLRP
jgi:hypothetical protein